MDDAQFQQLLANGKQKLQAKKQQAAPTVDHNVDPETGFNTNPAGATLPDGTVQEALGDITSPIESAVGGMLKSAFEVKDFVAGDTAKEDRSEVRRAVEDTVQSNVEEGGMVDGLAAGIGQFAGGMIGLSKMTQGLRLLPGFGAGLGGLLAPTGKVAKVAVESGRAALVGATAFDPFEERLSNLIQDSPLANPLTGWLAADPSDAAWEGRAKAALESIGMDAVLIGTFMATAKAWKYAKLGNEEMATATVKELEAEVKAGSAEVPEEVAPAAAVEDTFTPTEVASFEQRSAEGLPNESQRESDYWNWKARGADDQGIAAGSPEEFRANVDPAEEVGRPVDPEIEVDVVAGVKDAKTLADPMPPPKQAMPRIQLADEDTFQLYDNMVADDRAYLTHGGWTQTVETGHTFGRGEGIPWQKLGSDQAGELNNFMARVVDAAEEKLTAGGVGQAISDKRLEAMIRARTALTGEEPAQLMSLIQQAGERSVRMAADMEASYIVSQRMFMDTFALATRINMGDFTAYGTKEAALQELKKRASVAASVYGSARKMSSSAGRSLRRMRSDFELDPEAVGRLAAIDGDGLVNLIISTGGNTKSISKVLQKGLLERATDTINFVLINNLVSGIPTQLINLTTNSYMVGVRPLERMIGATLKGNGAMFRENVKQYGYTGTALSQGFKFALTALKRNDSVISPHTNEINSANQRVGQPMFKPFDGTVGNLLHNAGHATMAALGTPTRVLGGVDEMVKQTVYRSKVMAEAHMKAAEEGVQLGLTGDALKAHVSASVKTAVDNAFDDMGRGVDPKALQEAHIATFQQALLTSADNPGGKNTFGSTVQQGVTKHPGLRFILPFVKTPTNVVRYGWKMTPGLNLVQKEYKAMLDGKMGPEAQAQAYGQMATGTLWVGAAATAVYSGSITGAGPSDPKAKAALMATGWRPYSIPVKNEDGTTTWYGYGRYDPVAVPIGIIADLQDAIEAVGENDMGVQEAMGALAIALAKQFTNKSYMSSLDKALDALYDPEKLGERFAGQMASNMVPFSAMLRNTNPDPHLKEARDIMDSVMATIPGMAGGVPNRYDPWGDPVLARRGLWATGTDEAVDTEVQRMFLEGGEGPEGMQPNRNGIDLRDITMVDGKNAYAHLQELSKDLGGRTMPMKEKAAKLMETDAYKALADGPASEKGTKLWLLSKAVLRPYREAAFKLLKQDPNVRAALGERTEKVRKEYYDNLERIKAEEDGPAPAPKTATEFVDRMMVR